MAEGETTEELASPSVPRISVLSLPTSPTAPQGRPLQFWCPTSCLHGATTSCYSCGVAGQQPLGTGEQAGTGPSLGPPKSSPDAVSTTSLDRPGTLVAPIRVGCHRQLTTGHSSTSTTPKQILACTHTVGHHPHAATAGTTSNTLRLCGHPHPTHGHGHPRCISYTSRQWPQRQVQTPP